MSSKRRVGVAHFLQRTYEMLETQKLKNLIEWSPCGEYFYIKNTREFANKILPQYFRHKNFQSFLRQLNMYNFIKKRLKNGWNQFSHKHFRRDAKHLLYKVHRRSNGSQCDEEEYNNSKELQERQAQEFSNIKSQQNQILMTFNCLLAQQKLVSESFSLIKTKLFYQCIEEQRQEQFINYTFNLLSEREPCVDSPKQSQTILSCNQKSYQQEPQLFVLS